MPAKGFEIITKLFWVFPAIAGWGPWLGGAGLSGSGPVVDNGTYDSFMIVILTELVCQAKVVPALS